MAVLCNVGRRRLNGDLLLKWQTPTGRTTDRKQTIRWRSASDVGWANLERTWNSMRMPLTIIGPFGDVDVFRAAYGEGADGRDHWTNRCGCRASCASACPRMQMPAPELFNRRSRQEGDLQHRDEKGGEKEGSERQSGLFRRPLTTPSVSVSSPFRTCSRGFITTRDPKD